MLLFTASTLIMIYIINIMYQFVWNKCSFVFSIESKTVLSQCLFGFWLLYVVIWIISWLICAQLSKVPKPFTYKHWIYLLTTSANTQLHFVQNDCFQVSTMYTRNQIIRWLLVYTTISVLFSKSNFLVVFFSIFDENFMKWNQQI